MPVGNAQFVASKRQQLSALEIFEQPRHCLAAGADHLGYLAVRMRQRDQNLTGTILLAVVAPLEQELGELVASRC